MSKKIEYIATVTEVYSEGCCALVKDYSQKYKDVGFRIPLDLNLGEKVKITFEEFIEN